jgi:hypothetical protein
VTLLTRISLDNKKEWNADTWVTSEHNAKYKKPVAKDCMSSSFHLYAASRTAKPVEIKSDFLGLRSGRDGAGGWKDCGLGAGVVSPSEIVVMDAGVCHHTNKTLTCTLG